MDTQKNESKIKGEEHSDSQEAPVRDMFAPNEQDHPHDGGHEHEGDVDHDGQGQSTWLPQWLPIWGGKDFEFFSPVFNLADVWVSAGVILLLFFQKRFFPKQKNQKVNEVIT